MFQESRIILHLSHSVFFVNTKHVEVIFKKIHMLNMSADSTDGAE